jgi:3-oxoacyl-[acyl-carrier protein] reductase
MDGIGGVWARERGSRKIRVNTINPGMVETEGATTAAFIGSDFEKELIAQAPLGRTGRCYVTGSAHSDERTGPLVPYTTSD